MQFWLSWPADVLAETLDIAFPKAGVDLSHDWIHSFNKLFVELDVRREESYRAYINGISTLEMSSMNQTTAMPEVIKTLIANLIKIPPGVKGRVTTCNRTMQRMLTGCVNSGKLTTLSEYTIQFEQLCMTGLRTLERSADWDNRRDEPASSGNTSSKSNKRPAGDQFHSGKRQNTSTTPRKCEGCGNNVHPLAKVVENECPNCTGHPDRNTAGPWVDSQAYQTLSSKGFNSIHRRKYVNGTDLPEAIISDMAAQKSAKFPFGKADHSTSGGDEQGPSGGGRGRGRGGGRGAGGRWQGQGRGRGQYGGRGRSHSGNLCTTDRQTYMNNENDLIHCELITDGSNLLNIQVLLDSGSRSTDRDNYVSSKVAAWIRDTKVNVNNTCSLAPEVAFVACKRR